MNENIIAWNVTNWVTVVLMAAIGFFIIGAGLKWRQTRMATKGTPVNTTVQAASLGMA